MPEGIFIKDKHRSPARLFLTQQAKLLLLILFIVPFVGCPPSQKSRDIGKIPVITSDDPQAELEMREAKHLFDKGLQKEAALRYQSFIENRRDDPLVPVAQLFLGRIFLSQNRIDEARSLFRSVIAHEDTSLAEQGRFYDAVAAHLQGDHRYAIKTLRPMMGRTIDPADTVLLLRTLAAAYAQIGDFVNTLSTLDVLTRESISNRDKEEAKSEAREIINKRASPENIEKAYLELDRNGSIWPTVAKRALRDADQRGDIEKIRRIVETLQDEEIKLDDEMERIAIRAARPTEANPRIIGAILSLSGRARELGEQSLRGLMLAADLPPNGPITADTPQVVFRDDKADPERAIQAVDELVSLHRVIAIIGPIDSHTAPAAAQRAQELGVPLITLTPAGQVTKVGPMIFRLFTTPESETRKLVKYATKNKIRRFAILHPKGAYGKTMVEAFTKQVQLQGGEVVDVQSYQPTATSFGKEIASLKESRFESLFIADSSQRVALIAPALAAADLWSTPVGEPAPNNARSILLLAPSVAFNHQLAASANRYLQGAVFSIPFDPNTATGQGLSFSNQFIAKFDDTPNIFAAFSYDAYQFLRSALDHNAATRDAVAEYLRTVRRLDTAGPNPGFDRERNPIEGTRLVILKEESFVPLDI